MCQQRRAVGDRVHAIMTCNILPGWKKMTSVAYNPAYEWGQARSAHVYLHIRFWKSILCIVRLL